MNLSLVSSEYGDIIISFSQFFDSGILKQFNFFRYTVNFITNFDDFIQEEKASIDKNNKNWKKKKKGKNREQKAKFWNDKRKDTTLVFGAR